MFILRHDNKYSTKIIFACMCVHERNRIIKASNYQNLHTEIQQADDKIITSSPAAIIYSRNKGMPTNYAYLYK